MAIILSNHNRFTQFFIGRFFGKFAVNWLLKIPPHRAYVATLPCETFMSENKLHISGVVGLLVSTFFVFQGKMLTVNPTTPCNLSLNGLFSNVSYGSVATHARCGGIFNNQFTNESSSEKN